MARHNSILLYGLVTSAPKIIKNDESGTYLQGICPIRVIRGQRDAGDRSEFKHIKYDDPIIVTGESNLVKKMDEWEPGDMVLIKGVLVTKDVNKKVTCKTCGKVHIFQGSSEFVRPIYLETCMKKVPKENVVAELKKRIEISNVATLIGTVCKKPEMYTTEKKLHVTQFPIAINRKYKIPEDALEIRTDFPYVKSYGTQADKDYQYLDVGSVLMIDGCIQTREFERLLECDCGATTKWYDSSLEIIPYQSEYFNKNNSSEEESAATTNNNTSIADEILK